MDIAAQLALIQTRLADLAALDPAHELNAPIDEDVIVELEERWSFRLPEDYRAFITQLGNGGAGPPSGLLPFMGEHPDDDTDYTRLGEPFPYFKPVNPIHLLDDDDENEDDEPADDEWGEEFEHIEGEDSDPLSEDDEREYRLNSYRVSFTDNGWLLVCKHVDGTRSLLVTHGDSRGQIWIDARGSLNGFLPATTTGGERHTFATWYLEWLDETLAKLRG